ncbi:hypothetical protein ACCO45_010210 [Purpureocillium lilacinum]|uniref:Uncharacterized protein n=1 Tax=Purpureocillium lilacinum TaxID=33203 RepID=A0ACC4DFP1_PURLI
MIPRHVDNDHGKQTSQCHPPSSAPRLATGRAPTRALLSAVHSPSLSPTYVLPASVSILRLVHVKTQRSASDECCALDNVMFEAQGTRDCMISVLIRVARVGRKGRRPRPPNERRPHGEGIGALGVGMSGRRLLQARGIPASHPPPRRRPPATVALASPRLPFWDGRATVLLSTDSRPALPAKRPQVLNRMFRVVPLGRQAAATASDSSRCTSSACKEARLTSVQGIHRRVYRDDIIASLSYAHRVMTGALALPLRLRGRFPNMASLLRRGLVDARPARQVAGSESLSCGSVSLGQPWRLGLGE